VNDGGPGLAPRASAKWIVRNSTLQAVRLVGDVKSHLTKLLLVGAGVMSAEEQLASTRHHCPQEGLGAASVTAVSNAQSCCVGGNGGVHMSLVSVLVTYIT
jgi:hypothetical protein